MYNFEKKHKLLNKSLELYHGGGKDEKNPEEQKNKNEKFKKPILDETREQTGELNIDVVKKRLNKLKDTYPDLYAELKANGILLNSIETEDEFEKLKIYMEYLNYLYNVTRLSDGDLSVTSQEISKEGKTNIVKKYKELRSEKTHYIMNKRFLEYKYLEAVVKDVNNMGYNIEKNENGKYIIRDIKTLKVVKNSEVGVYQEILEKESLNQKTLDTAILSDIIVDNFDFNNVIHQKDFINKLFNNYGILEGRDDEDKTKYIIVDKSRIISEIKEKINNAPDIQTHQELTYLKNFVLNYRKGKDLANFNEANIYAKGFLKEKAFLNACRTGEIEGLGDPTKSTPDQIAEFIQKNRGSSIILGIISWIMGYKKTGLAAIGLGLFGGTVSEIVSGVGNKGGDILNGDNIIEPIKEGEIAPYLDEADDYQNKFDSLIVYNFKRKGGKMEKVGNVYRPAGEKKLKNDVLFDIVNTITTKSINIDLNSSGIVTALKEKLGGDFTEEQIKTFLDLLKKSRIKEDGDKTTLDYLYKGGRDILNQSYKGKNITGKEFDNEINKILGDEFDSKKDRKTRKMILKIRDKMSGEFNVFKEALNKLKDLDISSFNDYEIKINNVLGYIKAEYPELEKKFKSVFDAYKKYLKTEKEIAPFEGIFDSKKDEYIVKIEKFYSVTDPNLLDGKLTEKIDKLKKLRIEKGSDLLKYETFQNQNERIDKLIEKLEGVRTQLRKQEKEKLSKDLNINASESFNKDNKIEDLGLDIDQRNTNLEDTIKSIKTNDSFSNIYLKLEDISGDLSTLDKYYLAIKDVEFTTDEDSVFETSQKYVKQELKNYSEKKEELKNLVKITLEGYYKGNKSKLNSLSKISNKSEISDDLLIIKDVKSYLESKGVLVTSEQKQLIEDLRKNTGKVEELLKARKKSQESASNGKDKVDRSLYDNAIKSYNEFTSWLSEFSIKTKGEIALIDDKISSYLDQIIRYLKDVNSSDVINESKDLLKRAENLFESEDIGVEINDLLKKAKEVLGKEGFEGISGVSLDDIKIEYDKKIEEIEKKAENEVEAINNIDKLGIDKLRDKYEELEKIVERFPNLKNIVEKKQKKIAYKYLADGKLSENLFLSEVIKQISQNEDFKNFYIKQNIEEMKIDKFIEEMIKYYMVDLGFDEKDLGENPEISLFFKASQKIDLVLGYKKIINKK